MHKFLHRYPESTRIILWSVVIFIIAAALRTILLNTVPIAIPNDNLNFVINAKSIYYTGRDISGIWSPWMLTPVPFEPAQAELPYAIIAPFIGPFQFSLLHAHIFYALTSSFMAVLLFLIGKRLVGFREGVSIGLVSALNPWSIIFGRTAFEAPLAVFFYTLAFYLILATKGWYKLFAFVPFLLGFYTYMGFKLIFLPYVAIVLLVSFFIVDKRKSFKPLITLFVLCLIPFLFFLITVRHQTTGFRLSQLALYDKNVVSTQVNNERQLAITTPFVPVFVNKLTVAAKYDLEKYLGAFSFNYLFLYNEDNPPFTFWNHGYFYITDLVFLVVGFSVLFWKNRKLWFGLLLILLLAPLPSVLSTVTVSYSQRSSLMLPVMYIFIGIGISYLFALYPKRLYKILASSILIGIYALQLVNFLHIYFFINPIQNAEGMEFSTRVAIRYISLASQNGDVIIVTPRPKNTYKNYLFYTNTYTRDKVTQVQEAVLHDTYRIGNITFTTCNQTQKIDPETTYVIQHDTKCNKLISGKTLQIPQLKDGGSIYTIAQDTVCSNYPLQRYPRDIRLHDFQVEKLSSQDFCTKFITRF